jgi:hypothetical protein
MTTQMEMAAQWTRSIVLVAHLATACTSRPTGAQEWARRVAGDAQLSLPAGSRVVEFYEPDYFVDPVWVAK